MKELKNTIDTWNVIEKYDITDYTSTDHIITISDDDFQKMLYGSKNKSYIKNLLASNGRFCSHENI